MDRTDIHLSLIMGTSLGHGAPRANWISGWILAVVLIASPLETPAGPELPDGERTKGAASGPVVEESANPSRPRFQLPKLLHSGNYRTHRRPIGWGSGLNPYYGPTYYYPSSNNYRASNPTYYPFFQERLWPNYKSEPPSRDAGWFSWLRKPKPVNTQDEYDTYRRDGRYGERQWNR